MNNDGVVSTPSRRSFLRQIAGATTAAISGAVLSSQTILGANDRVRLGLIGAGSRGTEILKAALRCANIEGVAAADVYTHRLDAIKRVAPQLKIHTDFFRSVSSRRAGRASPTPSGWPRLSTWA